MFTLATVTLQRTAHDLRFAQLSAEQIRKQYVARAGVATVLAGLNSEDGGADIVEDIDVVLQNLPATISTQEIDGYRVDVTIYPVEETLETLRFEGKAYPPDSSAAASYYNVTVVKQHKNDPVLVAKTVESFSLFGTNKLPGIFYLRESRERPSTEDDWVPLPPAPAYDYGGGLLAPEPVVEARRAWQNGPTPPAWLLTQPTFDQTGKFYVQFQNVLSVLRGKNVIYVYDINTGGSDSPTEVSENWRVLPPIPPPDASDLPTPENLQDLFLNATLGLPSVLGQMSVDGNGRVVVSRHGLRVHSLWRFTPTEGAPLEGPMIAGEWRQIDPPAGIENPSLMSPVTDDKGNIYALWGDDIGSLLKDFFENPQTLISPDTQSGEIELGTIDGLNTVYRLEEGAEDWELLGPIPNLLYIEEDGHLIVDDRGEATNIAGISVGQSGELYALVINHEGPDSMLKYAGGRWQLLPATPAREPGSTEVDSEHLADFNNFALDSRMRLYGKDPNVGDGRIGIDTIYQYKGGQYQTVPPIARQPLTHDLRWDPEPKLQQVHQLGGGGLLTEGAGYQFVPVASY